MAKIETNIEIADHVNLPEFEASRSVVPATLVSLHLVLDKARDEIESARTFADVLEPRETARRVYDDARRAARIAKAKGAHDELVAATHRLKADALEIEAQAARRLADEYDGAQQRGEVAANGQYQRAVPDENSSPLATADDIGLSRKEIFEARQLRDAEQSNPGVTRRAIDAMLERGEDPTRAELKREIVKADRFFTEEDNGLLQEWSGRVWLNPPYAQPAISDFIEKMVSEWDRGQINSAIMLTHNYTDTSWFQKAARACSAICFTRGRIRFKSPTGEVAAPTQGQAFFYFGAHVDIFAQEFSEIGFVVEVRQ